MHKFTNFSAANFSAAKIAHRVKSNIGLYGGAARLGLFMYKIKIVKYIFICFKTSINAGKNYIMKIGISNSHYFNVILETKHIKHTPKKCISVQF